jgi:hypothetical protein
LEVTERQSFNSILNFVSRVIHMMNFLRLFSGDQTVLKQTVDLIGDNDL